MEQSVETSNTTSSGVAETCIVAEREIPRILIDTDAGLDDAAALFIVLAMHKQERVNVTAITTSYGNTSLINVNKNVLRVLQTVDLLDIPVYSGAVSNLVLPGAPYNPTPHHGFDGFGNTNLPHPELIKYLQKQHAANKIIDEARNSKGSLRILTLGPLTNLALAKRLEPSLLCQLASLHIMGGNTTGEGSRTACAEFNFVADPEAAHIVLSRDIDNCAPGSLPGNFTTTNADGSASVVLEQCPIYITPWETCLRALSVPYDKRIELGNVNTPQAQLINKAEAESLKKKFFKYHLSCDQLSASWMLDILLGDSVLPEHERASYVPLCKESVECRVTVELQGQLTRGQMVLDRRSRIPHSVPATVLTAVNQPYYLRYLGLAFGRKF